jgi:glutathione S-transferase
MSERLRLYILPLSHPCETARLMLRHKGLTFKETELPGLLCRWLLPRLGFEGKTVPALAAGKERIQGTRALSRWLDEHQPDPPLFPAGPERRQAVSEVELWGDEILQDLARRIRLWALPRDSEALARLAALSSVPAPRRLAVPLTRGILLRMQRIRGVSDESLGADLAMLPETLDRVDAWIADGTIGGDEPNAADFQLAPSLAELLGMEDLRPLIAGRPAAGLASRYVSTWPGSLSARVLPVPRVNHPLAPS